MKTATCTSAARLAGLAVIRHVLKRNANYRAAIAKQWSRQTVIQHPVRRRFVATLLLAASLALLPACHSPASRQNHVLIGSPTSLTFSSLIEGPVSDLETQRLNHFAACRPHLRIRHITAFETSDAQLRIYQQLFNQRSPQPDICEIDVIWPGIVGDDLVDLKPYFQAQLQDFPADLLRTYTVHGRLIALPVMVDTGMLYYREDLVHKYGFKGPPDTWEDLERMALVIQRGERRAGNANFWGYVWQGGANEALTCNALEWQASQGGGQIIEPDGTVSIGNPRAIQALERAVSWIGSISPPGVAAYSEDDSLNVYAAGNAAFIRQWSSVYTMVLDRSQIGQTSVALMPRGSSGRGRTLGGLGVGISKYSTHRDESAAALRDLLSAESQAARASRVGIPPTLLSLERRPELMSHTPFHGPLLNGQMLTGIVARPSLTAGPLYSQVSLAYYLAIHSALTHQASPTLALTRLQTELVRITKSQASP